MPLRGTISNENRNADYAEDADYADSIRVHPCPYFQVREEVQRSRISHAFWM